MLGLACRTRYVWPALALATALTAAGCDGRSLGQAATAGTSGAAGTAGAAGTSGAASTSGAAGTAGAAGGPPAAGAADTGVDPASGAIATRADGRCVQGAFKRMTTGLCTCQPDVPSVCGDACTELSRDNANCGACGHACAATSVCNAGVCGPEATTFLPAAPGCTRLDLAIAGGNLYWSDQGHGTISRRALAGGPTTPLAASEKSPSRLLVRGATLFWIDVVATKPITSQYGIVTDETTATIRKAALAGGAPMDLATETNLWGGIRGLAVSDDGLTLFYSSDTKIRAVPVTGGTPTDVGSEERGGIPTGLGVAGSYIGYITDLNGNVDVINVTDGAVARCGGINPADMTGESLLMVNCVRIGGCTPDALMEKFIVRGEKAYWGDGATLWTGPVRSDSPLRANKDSVTYGLSSEGGAFSGLVDAPDALYFAQPGWQGNGLVEKTSYELSSTPVALVRGQNVPRSLAVNESKVYWSTADCAIFSAPR
jgi:hypothetical protein